MLQAKTKEQKEHILDIVGTGCNVYESGVDLYKSMSYDTLAEIVDYLRKEDNARRKKARWAAMKSEVDGLWVSGDTIFLKGAEKDEAVKFIQSLGEFGYGVDTLMEEYNKTGKITI